MFRALLRPVQSVLEVPFKRIIKYAVKSSAFGRYLKHDLHFEQFCVSLTSGEAELCDVDLDCDAILNDLDIADTLAEAGLRIRKASIERLFVKAFGGSKDGLFISLTGLRIIVVPDSRDSAGRDDSASCNEIGAHDKSPGQKQIDMIKRDEHRQFDLDDSIDQTSEEELSRAAQDGLQALGNWIEEYAAGLQVQVEDIVLEMCEHDCEHALPANDIQGRSLDSRRYSKIVAHIPTVSFEDVTDGLSDGPIGGKRHKSVEIGEIVLRIVHIPEPENEIAYYEQVLMSASGNSAALLGVQQESGALENLRVTLPWIKARLSPQAVANVTTVLTSYESAEPKKIYKKRQESTRELEKAGQDNDEEEFYDALSEADFSDALDEREVQAHDGVDEKREDQGQRLVEKESDIIQHAKVENFLRQETHSSEERESRMSIEIQVLRWQIELLYTETVTAPPSTFSEWAEKDLIAAHVDKWLTSADPDHNAFLHDAFDTPKSDCPDRFVIRAMGFVVRAEIACGANFAVNDLLDGDDDCHDTGGVSDIRASLELGQCGATELLTKSPFGSPLDAASSPGFVHVVVDMDTSTVQACRVNLIVKSSLTIKLSPLIISWDNNMAERMYGYLPEEGAPEDEIQDMEQSQAPTPLSSSTLTVESTTPPRLLNKLNVRVISPKALMVVRVPQSLASKNCWKKEALVIDMTDVEARTAKRGTGREFGFTSFPCVNVGQGGHDDGESAPNANDFYSDTEALRRLIWRAVVDFAYAKVRIASVSTGFVSWSLIEEPDLNCSHDHQTTSISWAITIGASADLSSAQVALPRMVLCMRRPFSSPDTVARSSRRALASARSYRRAFKTRVHQRRDPGEAGSYDQADPAGDHDLEKDRDSPVHAVLEQTIAHGFATAESSVRLSCPTATIKLDRVEYHSINAILQLIIGTIPTFTRPNKASSSESESIGAENSEHPSFGEDKQQDLHEDMEDTCFWDHENIDDSFEKSHRGKVPVSAESSQLPDFSEPDSSSNHKIVEESRPAALFFQMESSEGRVEISDESAGADYLFNYFGLQISLVDSMTLIESSDLTLNELLSQSALTAPQVSQETSEPARQAECPVLEPALSLPVFYSTKWGRHARQSPPLVQLFIDSSPILRGEGTTVISMCVEALSLRYRPQSNWLADITAFLGSAPPEGAMSLGDSVSSQEREHSVIYTEMTVEFYDSIVEYRPGVTTSKAGPAARSIPTAVPQSADASDGGLMNVGLFRMSSNIATPAVSDQSYHVTCRDIAFYATNDAPPWQATDHLCATLLPQRAYNTHVFSSIDDFTGCMLYVKLATLDILELFVRIRDQFPRYNYELSVPQLALYTCHDSLVTLSDLVQQLSNELAIEEQTVKEQEQEQEPQGPDNTAMEKDTRGKEEEEKEEALQSEGGVPNATAFLQPVANEEPEIREAASGEKEGDEVLRDHAKEQSAELPMADVCRDDEKSASQLRECYLSSKIPDDQLSGAQLRSRHAAQSAMFEDEPGAVFVDGFYAVEEMEFTHTASRLTSQEAQECGTWFDTDCGGSTHQVPLSTSKLPPVPKNADKNVTVGSDDQDKITDKNDIIDEASPRLLLWENPDSGEQEEFELDELEPDPKGGPDERASMRQVEEDERRAAREQRKAADEYAGMLRAEYPDCDLYNAPPFFDDDAEDDLDEISDCANNVRSQASSHASSHAKEVRPGQPSGGWYQEARVKIYPHYMGIPFEAGPGSHVPPAEALAARLEGGRRRPNAPAPIPKGHCDTRYIIRDLSVQWFLFGGCDWNSTALANERRTKEGRRRAAAAAAARANATAPGEMFSSADCPGLSSSKSKSSKPSVDSPRRRLRHRLAGRQTDTKIQITLEHVSACVSYFLKTDSMGQLDPFIQQSIAVAVRDFHVVDHLAASLIHQMLCEWVSEVSHPRITGSSMLRFAYESIRRPGKGVRDTSCVRLSLLPLKANLDQDALEFLLHFLSIEPLDATALAALAAEEARDVQAQGRRGEKLEFDDNDDVAEQLEAMAVEELARAAADEDAELGVVIVTDDDFRIDTVDIRAAKLRIDYRPKRVSLNGLIEGDRLALVNLLAYEGLEVALRRVELDNIRGWHGLSSQVQACWMADVSRQKLNCLAGVSFPPINTVANLGTGLTNLVVMPLEQYKRDGRIVHGVRRGTASFVRTVAIETLGTLSKAAVTAQTLLETVRDAITPSQLGQGVAKLPTRMLPPPGRSHHGVRGLGTGENYGSQPLSAQNHAAAALALGSGRDNFARELKCAAFVLFAMPLEEYRRAGVASGVKSALKGVPIAVVQTGIGLSGAISTGLTGLKNAVDPDSEKEISQKYKALKN